MNIAITVFRFINLLICINGILPDSSIKQYSGLIKNNSIPPYFYLTNLGLYFTILTLILYFLSKIRYQRLQLYIKEVYYVFTINTIGIESIVVIGYWTLYLINPKLVVNAILYDAGYRTSWNKEISMHLYPLIAVCFEGYFLKFKKSKDFYATLIVFSCLYFALSLLCNRIYGRYQYNFLGNINMLGRIISFVGFTILAIVMIEGFNLLKKVTDKK